MGVSLVSGCQGWYVSILGFETLSGDPGFAWMAFPVKLRVVPGDVAGWP